MNTALTITVAALTLALVFAFFAGVLGAFRRFTNNWREGYHDADLSHEEIDEIPY